MEIFNSVENVLWLIWLGVGVAFLVAELMVPAFIVIFFGVGALIAGVTAFFGSTIQVQLVVFGVSSLALLLLFRRVMASTFSGSTAGDEEVDGAIGGQAEVVEAIEPPQPGRIKFQGSFWGAHCSETVPAGAVVRIVKRDEKDVNAFVVEKEN
ncbi:MULTISPECIES: NfeD family protein [unclassified Pseudodesulfovibrio]|uniref:NfeD family protein n=1 Tax=unclassified Pseudodesulfovibrio TaxID=2661612 RepID=UPI000FEBC119|nr:MULTISPECIES: NfeD family protein [unclassified Pseudodesulfovibrio]MCJ2165099.1 NfeD family protein [Pseudodesulfovibrio sp. S3-i]RWU03436.1 NfeD family protein [Pseudodesulfovibrio sp. S3]